jgi:hypothetical protein
MMGKVLDTSGSKEAPWILGPNLLLQPTGPAERRAAPQVKLVVS